jgi:hypothetical protein
VGEGRVRLAGGLVAYEVNVRRELREALRP